MALDLAIVLLLLQSVSYTALPVALTFLLARRLSAVNAAPLVDVSGPGRGYGLRRFLRFTLLPARDRYAEMRAHDPIGFSVSCGFTVAEFDYLLSRVRALLEGGMRVRSSVVDPTAPRQGRPWRRKLSPACGLFLTLQFLRDYCPLRSLAVSYNLCDTSISELVLHTVYCLHEGLQGEIVWPTAAQAAQLCGVGMPAGIGDCFAFVDATCTYIRRPEVGQHDFYRGDKKRHFINSQERACASGQGFSARLSRISLACVCVSERCPVCLQLVCLRDGTIVHLSTQHKGRDHDSTVYLDSGVVSHLHVGSKLLADGAYSGLPGVLAPFRRTADPDKMLYNEKLRSVRVVVEHGINAVKQEWAIVREKVRHSDKEFLGVAIEVCCQLRNLMRRLRD
jgi:hypothetical protein